MENETFVRKRRKAVEGRNKRRSRIGESKETLAPKENEDRIRFGQSAIDQNGGIRTINQERQEERQKNTHHPALEAEREDKEEQRHKGPRVNAQQGHFLERKTKGQRTFIQTRPPGPRATPCILTPTRGAQTTKNIQDEHCAATKCTETEPAQYAPKQGPPRRTRRGGRPGFRSRLPAIWRREIRESRRRGRVVTLARPMRRKGPLVNLRAGFRPIERVLP